MRLVYLDEAGTSRKEPVCIVAGVLVEGDRQHRAVSQEIRRLRQQNLIGKLPWDRPIHATEIFSGGKHIDREKWPFPERREFLYEMLSLPRKFDLPIAAGIVHKESMKALPDVVLQTFDGWNRTAHLYAFHYALDRADHFLRKYLNNSEQGVAICEDVPEFRSKLKFMAQALRLAPLHIGPEGMQQSDIEKMLGKRPEGHTYRIENIIDVPHFVEKPDAELLQLADCCAFAFRHYMSGRKFGLDLLAAMIGPAGALEFDFDTVWKTGGHSVLFYDEKHAPKSYLEADLPHHSFDAPTLGIQK